MQLNHCLTASRARVTPCVTFEGNRTLTVTKPYPKPYRLHPRSISRLTRLVTLELVLSAARQFLTARCNSPFGWLFEGEQELGPRSGGVKDGARRIARLSFLRPFGAAPGRAPGFASLSDRLAGCIARA